jgi:hypothetical protein
MGFIDADHADEGGRYGAMARALPCISRREHLIGDLMGVQRIEAQNLRRVLRFVADAAFPAQATID